MNIIFKNIKENRNDPIQIKILINEIRSRWKYYSYVYPYDHFTFNEAISELLNKIDDPKYHKSLSKSNGIRNAFTDIYNKLFENNKNSNLLYIEDPEDLTKLNVEDLNISKKYDFSRMDNSDFLIVFNSITSKTIPSDRSVDSLVKLRINDIEFKDEDILNSINYSNLFLINELGIKKFFEYNTLLSKLNIEYMSESRNDSLLSIEVKTRILEKFIDSIKNVSVDNYEVIEKLIFKD